MPIQKGPANLGTGTIDATELASNSVTTAKIADANVTTAKLATTLTVTHALGSASTPSITFTGDTNTGIFSPTADTIAFAEGGAEVVRIDSSGRLLVGTTSTTTSSSQSGEVYSAGATGFLLTNTTAANFGLSVKNEGTSGTRNLINFLEGTGGGTARANISFDSANSLTFSTGGTARISIPVDAGGIKFPATQVASSDANTLDDYEEGTWTPTVTFGGAAVGVTYDATYRRGWYTKVGNVVTCKFALEVTNKGSSVGNVEIRSFPFNSTQGDASVSHAISHSSLTVASPITAYGTVFNGTLSVVKQNSGAQSNVTNSDCPTSFSLLGTITYLI
jgi:hypothetical protein